jgi:hypothetical protein
VLGSSSADLGVVISQWSPLLWLCEPEEGFSIAQTGYRILNKGLQKDRAESALGVSPLNPSLPSPSTHHPSPITQHPSPSTQHSGLRTQHSALSTQHSALSTQHSAPRTQHSALSTQHSALSTQHSAPRTQHSGLRTQDPSLRTKHSFPILTCGNGVLVKRLSLTHNL